MPRRSASAPAVEQEALPSPFNEVTALEYLTGGLSVFPVVWLGDEHEPAKQYSKKKPPVNYTGNKTKWTTGEDLIKWLRIKRYHNRNIAGRLPVFVIGIDLDLYKGSHALADWQDLVKLLGELPFTCRITSRHDGSGIMLFRVPVGYKAREKFLKDAGEIISHTHRYVMLPPSVHPDTGEVYRFEDMPFTTVDDLPMLPETWLDYLAAESTIRVASPTSPGLKQTFGSAMSQAEVLRIVAEGLPANKAQEPVFFRFVWAMKCMDMDAGSALQYWQEAVSRTELKYPDYHWDDGYFWDYWNVSLDTKMVSPKGQQVNTATGEVLRAKSNPTMFHARDAVNKINSTARMTYPGSRQLPVICSVLRTVTDNTWFRPDNKTEQYGYVLRSHSSEEVIGSESGCGRTSVVAALQVLDLSEIINRTKKPKPSGGSKSSAIELAFLSGLVLNDAGKIEYTGPYIKLE